MAPHNHPTDQRHPILPVSLRPPPLRVCIPLVVKWAGHLQDPYGVKETRNEDAVHTYTLVSRPSFPLHRGAHVRLLAVSSLFKHVPGQNPILDPYIYDPHIQGIVMQTIQGAARRHGSVTLVITNECARNSIRTVSLAVPNTPDVFSPIRARKTPPVTIELEAAESLADMVPMAGIRMLERGCGGKDCPPSPFDGLDREPMTLLEMIMEDMDWDDEPTGRVYTGQIEALPAQEDTASSGEPDTQAGDGEEYTDELETLERDRYAKRPRLDG